MYSEDSNARLALQKQAVQNAVANQDGVHPTTQALSDPPSVTPVQALLTQQRVLMRAKSQASYSGPGQEH